MRKNAAIPQQFAVSRWTLDECTSEAVRRLQMPVPLAIGGRESGKGFMAQ